MSFGEVDLIEGSYWELIKASLYGILLEYIELFLYLNSDAEALLLIASPFFLFLALIIFRSS